MAQNYNALHDLSTVQTDEAKLSIENKSPKDFPHLEQNLMSVPELTPHKVIKLQKNNTFYKNILKHLHCSKNNKYFIDATGILQKKGIDFNSTFSALVVPQILIKCLLHASHDSLGHVEATLIYHFLKRLYYFQGMRKKIYQYVRSCHKCHIMNLKKSH